MNMKFADLKTYNVNNEPTRDWKEIEGRLEFFDRAFPNRQHYFQSCSKGHYVVYLEKGEAEYLRTKEQNEAGLRIRAAAYN